MNPFKILSLDEYHCGCVLLFQQKRSEILKRKKEKIMVAGIAIFSKSKIMKRLKKLSIGNSFHGKYHKFLNFT